MNPVKRYQCRPKVHLRVKVGQDPGKDGVLHQVVVGASCQRVQMHQVLEVTDLSSLENRSHTSVRFGFGESYRNDVVELNGRIKPISPGSYLPSLSDWLLTNQCTEESRSDGYQDREDVQLEQLGSLFFTGWQWKTFLSCKAITVCDL